MRQGSMIAGVLSLLGSASGFAIAFGLHDFMSMYTAIGVVLLLNAVVRFRMASGSDLDAHDAHDR